MVQLGAILARVSTDEQNVDAQLHWLRAQAKRDGVKLVAEYVDDGVSGKTGNLAARDGALRMIADLRLRPRPWDVLYVWDFDRLLRSNDIEEQAQLLAPLQRAGVAIRTRNGEQPPLSTMIGRMVALIQLEGSADWLEKHRERIKIGKDRAIAEGRKPAGPTPYGLAYSRERAQWTIVEAEATIMREILERLAAGDDSCETIARDLARRGVPTRRGGRWSRTLVWNIATARTVVGEWTADKRRGLVVKVPAIASEEQWQAAQSTLLGYGLRGLRRTTHVYLLERIALCALCGARIGVNWGGGTGPARRPYYICSQRRDARGDDPRCTLPMQRTDGVDVRVWDKISEVLQRPDHLARYLDRRRGAAHQVARAGAEDLRAVEAKLRRLQQVEAALLIRFQDSLISPEAMDLALRRSKAQRELLQRQLEAARVQRARARRERADVDAVLATAATLRARLPEATPEERFDLVHRLITGRGDHVARLGAQEIELNIELRETVSPVLQAAYSSQHENNRPRSLAIRVVA